MAAVDVLPFLESRRLYLIHLFVVQQTEDITLTSCLGTHPLGSAYYNNLSCAIEDKISSIWSTGFEKE